MPIHASLVKLSYCTEEGDDASSDGEDATLAAGAGGLGFTAAADEGSVFIVVVVSGTCAFFCRFFCCFLFAAENQRS